MNRIPRRLATRLTHEVACWCTFEYEQGAFGEHRHPFKPGKVWRVEPRLRNACTVASFILHRAIEWHGYEAAIIYHNHHFWVHTACGLELDPTYGQFDKPLPRIARVGKLRVGQVISSHIMICAKCSSRLPNWPGHYMALMERVLRRMGVDAIEGTGCL